MNKLAFQGSIGAFALAVAALAVRALGFIDDTIFLVLIGLGGFSGLAALRAFIEEKGLKTYAVVIGGLLGVVGLVTNVATPEQVGYWFAALGLISGVTLGHAVYKSKQVK